MGPGQPYAGVNESFQVGVSLPGIPDVSVEIAVTNATAAHKGSVIVSGGAAGSETSFWKAGPITEWIFDQLRARGWRMIDLRWSRGWWQSGPGISILAQSGRYPAVVAGWLAKVYPNDWRVAYGVSGAASMIAYGLAHWGLGGDFRTPAPLRGAALFNGPPHARLDYGGGLAAFPACQAGSFPPQTFSCGVPPCSSPVNYVPYLDGIVAGTARSWSILNGHETLVHQAVIRMSLGLADCTIATTQAWEYWLKLKAAGNQTARIRFVPDMPHSVAAAPADIFSQIVVNEIDALSPS